MEIRYPSEKWLTDFMNAHKCDRETADMTWWDIEIEKGNPTPYDLDETAEAVSKEMRKGTRAVDAYGKERKRERKPDEDKRWLIDHLFRCLSMCAWTDPEPTGKGYTPEVVNPEREIRFGPYSVTITKHRTPKG